MQNKNQNVMKKLPPNIGRPASTVNNGFRFVWGGDDYIAKLKIPGCSGGGGCIIIATTSARLESQNAILGGGDGGGGGEEATVAEL